MKEIKLNVPDEKASAFAEEFVKLCKKHGVGVDGINPAKDDRPVTERIKTFEDALADLNKRAENGDKTAVELVDDWNGLVTDSAELIAYHKIRIIAYALNEGWEPQFVKGEYRWCPWFDLYTQQEIDNMDEEEKGRVLGRSLSSAVAVAGVASSRASNASPYSSASYGGRLCFKSEALAEYAGTQFLKEWSDLMMFTK
jgi:hypothetical protein